MPNEDGLLKRITDSKGFNILVVIGVPVGLVVASGRLIEVLFSIDKFSAYSIALGIVILTCVIALLAKQGKRILDFLILYKTHLFALMLIVTAFFVGFQLDKEKCVEMSVTNFNTGNINLIWNGDYISHEKRKDNFTKGVIQFTEVEDSVFGTYINPEGEINKLYAVKGKTDSLISGKWVNFEDDTKGTFEFEMQKGGTFEGTYKMKSGKGNTWSGKREGNIRVIENEIREILKAKEKRTEASETADPELELPEDTKQQTGETTVPPPRKPEPKDENGLTADDRKNMKRIKSNGYILVGNAQMNDSVFYKSKVMEFNVFKNMKTTRITLPSSIQGSVDRVFIWCTRPKDYDERVPVRYPITFSTASSELELINKISHFEVWVKVRRN